VFGSGATRECCGLEQKDMSGGACSWYGGDKKQTQSFGWETRKTLLRKIRLRRKVTLKFAEDVEEDVVGVWEGRGRGGAGESQNILEGKK